MCLCVCVCVCVCQLNSSPELVAYDLALESLVNLLTWALATGPEYLTREVSLIRVQLLAFAGVTRPA